MKAYQAKCVSIEFLSVIYLLVSKIAHLQPITIHFSAPLSANYYDYILFCSLSIFCSLLLAKILVLCSWTPISTHKRSNVRLTRWHQCNWSLWITIETQTQITFIFLFYRKAHGFASDLSISLLFVVVRYILNFTEEKI